MSGRNKKAKENKDFSWWHTAFSGFGLVAIQFAGNIINDAWKKYPLTIIINIITLIIVIALNVFFLVKLKKIKGDNSISKEKELQKKLDEMTENVDKYKRQLDEANNALSMARGEIVNCQREISNKENIIAYVNKTYDVLKKIQFALKKGEVSDTDLLSIVNEIEYIFRSEFISPKSDIDTSVFLKNSQNECYIRISSKHSQTTVDTLRLPDESLVGASFKRKDFLYCGNLDERDENLPFVEINGRRFNSILSVPLIVDDKPEFAIVITCSETDALMDTFSLYKDVIYLYLRLLDMLLGILASKEKMK